MKITRLGNNDETMRLFLQVVAGFSMLLLLSVPFFQCLAGGEFYYFSTDGISELGIRTVGGYSVSEDISSINSSTSKISTELTRSFVETKVYGDFPKYFDVVEDLPVEIDLRLLKLSTLKSELGIEIEIVSDIDIEEVEVSLLLPSGVSLLENSSWVGSLEKQLGKNIVFSVNADILVDDLVEVVAFCKEAGRQPQVASKSFSLNADPSLFSDIGLLASDQTEMIGESVLAPDNSGELSVCGRWFYYDQYFVAKPARFARVELWDVAFGNDVLLSTSYVESDGSYQFSPIINDVDPLEGGYDVYVKLVCDSDREVYVTSAIGQTYSFRTETLANVPDGVLDLGDYIVSGENRGCFGLYDGVVEAYWWLYDRVTWGRSEVQVRWPAETWPHSHGNRIDVPGGSNWEWDLPTIRHEYAHCIHYASRGGNWPPNLDGPDPHYIDSESSVGFALVEGWAEFMECAINDSPLGLGGSLESTVYADGPFRHGDYGDWDGNIVEGAVAAIFWDILDGITLSDFPLYSFGRVGDFVNTEFAKLWSIMLNYDPNSIDEIWTHWDSQDPYIWALFYNNRINKDFSPPVGPAVWSLTHPDENNSYPNDSPSFSWFASSDSLPSSGIAGYSFSFDANSSTIPDMTIDLTNNSISFVNVENGEWFFHLRAADNAGNWGLPSHFRVEIFIDDEPTGTVSGLLLQSGGSGYTTPAVIISGGSGSGAAATARVRNGVITEIILTNPGDGYVFAPDVIISDPNPRAKGAIAFASTDDV